MGHGSSTANSGFKVMMNARKARNEAEDAQLAAKHAGVEAQAAQVQGRVALKALRQEVAEERAAQKAKSDVATGTPNVAPAAGNIDVNDPGAALGPQAIRNIAQISQNFQVGGQGGSAPDQSQPQRGGGLSRLFGSQQVAGTEQGRSVPGDVIRVPGGKTPVQLDTRIGPINTGFNRNAFTLRQTQDLPAVTGALSAVYTSAAMGDRPESDKALALSRIEQRFGGLTPERLQDIDRQAQINTAEVMRLRQREDLDVSLNMLARIPGLDAAAATRMAPEIAKLIGQGEMVGAMELMSTAPKNIQVQLQDQLTEMSLARTRQRAETFNDPTGGSRYLDLSGALGMDHVQRGRTKEVFDKNLGVFKVVDGNGQAVPNKLETLEKANSLRDKFYAPVREAGKSFFSFEAGKKSGVVLNATQLGDFSLGNMVEAQTVGKMRRFDAVKINKLLAEGLDTPINTQAQMEAEIDLSAHASLVTGINMLRPERRDKAYSEATEAMMTDFKAGNTAATGALGTDAGRFVEIIRGLQTDKYILSQNQSGQFVPVSGYDASAPLTLPPGFEQVLGISRDAVVGPLNEKLGPSFAVGAEVMERMITQLIANGRIQARDMNIPILPNEFPPEVFKQPTPAASEAVGAALGGQLGFQAPPPTDTRVRRTQPLTAAERRAGVDPTFQREPAFGDPALRAVAESISEFLTTPGTAAPRTGGRAGLIAKRREKKRREEARAAALKRSEN